MPTSSKKSTILNAKCEACGLSLVVDPTGKGRIARFCSPSCRVAYHRGKRPPAENLPTLDDLLETLAELAEGHERTFSRELVVIRQVLIAHYQKKC